MYQPLCLRRHGAQPPVSCLTWERGAARLRPPPRPADLEGGQRLERELAPVPVSLSTPSPPPPRKPHTRTLTQRPLFPPGPDSPEEAGKNGCKRTPRSRTHQRSSLKGRGGFIRLNPERASTFSDSCGRFWAQTGTVPRLEPPPGRHLTLPPFHHRRAMSADHRGNWRSNWSNPTLKRSARPQNRIRRNPWTCRSTSPAPPRFKRQKRAPQSTLRLAAPSPASRPRLSPRRSNPSAPW